jgi:hypothetical protein
VFDKASTGREGNYEDVFSPPPKKFLEIYIYLQRESIRVVLYRNLKILFQRNGST